MRPASCYHYPALHGTLQATTLMFCIQHVTSLLLQCTGLFFSTHVLHHRYSQHILETGMLNQVMSTAEMHQACNICQVPDAAIAGLR